MLPPWRCYWDYAGLVCSVFLMRVCIFIKSRESKNCVTIFFCPQVFQLHNCSCHIWDPFRAVNTSCGCCKFSLGLGFCSFLWCLSSDRAGLFEWLQIHRYDSFLSCQPIFTSVNVRNLTYPSCKPPVWSVSGVLTVVMKTESRKRLLQAVFKNHRSRRRSNCEPSCCWCGRCHSDSFNNTGWHFLGTKNDTSVFSWLLFLRVWLNTAVCSVAHLMLPPTGSLAQQSVTIWLVRF